MNTCSVPGDLRVFRAEFHIHTVLSPCASVEMIPPLIIEEALKKNIDIIAITDHNATANISAVIQAAKKERITILPGVELHTREDIHILCLFPNIGAVNEFQAVLNDYLPTRPNQPDIFGPQYVVDHTGDFVREENKLLSQAASLSIEKAWEFVQAFNGLFIPAHINRSVYGILPTLGFLPENIHFDALEITPFNNIDELTRSHPSIQGYPLLIGGDAHYLTDILGLNNFLLCEPTFEEIQLALHNRKGRMLITSG